jgi:hypothetical protein
VNVVHHHTLRLIAVSAFAVILPTLASASSAEQTARFKLAMGPMSAAQKNQGPGTAEQSGSVKAKPHHRIKPHYHRIKHQRRHRQQQA